MKKILLILMIFLLVGGAFGVMAEESLLSLEKTEFAVGEAINVTAIGSGLDWIGIYYPDEPHSIRWQYVKDFGSGNSFDITKGVDNGGAPDILPAGEYIVRLMPNDSTNKAEALAEITITIGETAKPKTPFWASYTPMKSGYAEGVISVMLDEDDTAADDIRCYWADDAGPLAKFTPLAKFKVKNGEAECTLAKDLLIPEGATRLLVYTATRSGTLCEIPYEITLPEGAASTVREGLIAEFQVVSDLHITGDPSHIHDRHFEDMLRDIAAISPNSMGLFVVGDMADHGYRSEYEAMQSIYDRAIGVPPMFLTLGNHDLRNGAYADQIATFLAFATLPDGSHPESCHYDFWLNDYHFVFLGNDRMVDSVKTTLFKETTDWLDKTLAEGYEEGKPVFLFLHQSLYDTVAGSLAGQGWNGVQNEEGLRSVLAKYPDVIMFNGHSHWILDSERTMYPRSDTLPTIFNTSSVGYLWTSYDVVGGVEEKGSEGYHIRVYKDCVEVLGYDFENDTWVSSAQFAVPYTPKATEPPISHTPDTSDTPISGVTPDSSDAPTTTDGVGETPSSRKTILWASLGVVALSAVAGTVTLILKKKK